MKKTIILISSLVICIIFGIIFIFYKKQNPEARVAFVIDDWGYNRRNVKLLCQIDRPLTISILPNLYYSREIAATVRKDSVHDVILHLPLESKSDREPENNTIRTWMKKDEILFLLRDDIKSVPGVIGVSSHQGSKATEDKRLMGIVLGELKSRSLFFLDSKTTPNSVCPEVARDIGLKFAQRDIFLDLTDKTDLGQIKSYIKAQIKMLIDIARRQGKAIGIGHDRAVTLETIKESIPEIEQQGVQVVPLRVLVE